jgi:putative tryptophan/tyrosine transport system substrate-binding protein
MSSRREFITLLGGAVAAWPVVGRAQKGPVPVIGTLYGVSAANWAKQFAGFHRGLSEAGFVEGRNVALDYRWAEGRFDRLPAMAADLVGREVAAILVGGSDLATRAAMAATQTIPIVFTTAADPVNVGFVASLNRPGGNATGVTILARELEQKRLELLHQLLPAARNIALLLNANNPAVSQDVIQRNGAAARRLALEIVLVNGGSGTEIESAIVAAAQQGAAALLVSSDAFLNNQRQQIAALALRHALPTISGSRDAVFAGQLMSYGPNLPDMYRQAGLYVGRILKGEKPGDLPVIQPTQFELVINLNTAKTLGLEIPPTLLARADEVIE